MCRYKKSSTKRKKMKINGDQEGSRLDDLNLSPDES